MIRIPLQEQPFRRETYVSLRDFLFLPQFITAETEKETKLLLNYMLKRCKLIVNILGKCRFLKSRSVSRTEASRPERSAGIFKS